MVTSSQDLIFFVVFLVVFFTISILAAVKGSMCKNNTNSGGNHEVIYVFLTSTI